MWNVVDTRSWDEISAKLKTALASSEYSQRSVAEYADISDATISRWFSQGKQQGRALDVVRVGLRLGIFPNDLFLRSHGESLLGANTLNPNEGVHLAAIQEELARIMALCADASVSPLALIADHLRTTRELMESATPVTHSKARKASCAIHRVRSIVRNRDFDKLTDDDVALLSKSLGSAYGAAPPSKGKGTARQAPKV